MWSPNDRLTHRHNPELGPGRVVSVEGRTLVVEFPRQKVTLRLARDTDALQPLDLKPGRVVRVGIAGSESAVVQHLPDGRVRLEDGRVVSADDLWPVDLDQALVARLALFDIDPIEDFRVRMEALHLASLREAGGLGSFLGGRIRLFPHQLHVALRATASLPVRWLLADEVGLGKTIEACLILNRLLRAGAVDRCLIVAPASLTVQWLGELWRKHHQVFVLMDEQRLADVQKDFGPEFNPFDTYRRAVIALETLVEQPRLSDQAAAAGIDLLVVDEAHRLRRPPGHPGNAAWRAVAPMTVGERNVLLLTAVPLEDDAHGFFRLLQLLRPADFLEDEGFEARLERAEPLPACTSSTRRVDIGGLPPRAAVFVDAGGEEAWAPRRRLVEALRRAPAPHVLARKQKAERIRCALATGAALLPLLKPEEEELRRLAAEADVSDPRLAWLLDHARGFAARGEKTLVFVAHRESLEIVRAALGERLQLATGAFHEELTPARRDIEVARFRVPEGPSVLVSTECGGEGRNFEFCTRLVLFDLPWSPMTVEQRIGRLDRIGRRIPVEVVVFRPPFSPAVDVAALFESLGLFREPLAGLEPELAGVEPALEAMAITENASLAPSEFRGLVAEAHSARTRIREAAHRELHRDPYRPELGPALLARVPPDLDDLNESVVLGACERLGFHVEPHRGGTYSIELGNEALVDNLPGVPADASFLGTFSREEAVEDESIDFFAAGHPLVEGVLAHLEEGPTGRVGALEIEGDESGLGLAAVYKDGPRFELVVLDAQGAHRKDWAAFLERRPFSPVSASPAFAQDPEWAETMRRLGALLDPTRRPVAVAGLVIRRRG